jgi:hypothetical protein
MGGAGYGTVLAGLVGLGGLCACTFPDVDYADGGGGSATSTSATPDECSGLAACEVAAKSCASNANGAHDACTQACKGNPGCTMKCDQAQMSALLSCATTCADSGAPGCNGAPAGCAAAAAP